MLMMIMTSNNRKNTITIYSGGTMAQLCNFTANFFFFQVGFPPGLKQFSGTVLCNNSGSRPVWGLRPWHQAGSLEEGQEALQGVKVYLSYWACWIHGSGGKSNVFGDGESFGTIFRSIRSTWRPWTGWRGWRRSRSTSRSEILSQLLSMLETWFWCPNKCFWA